MGERNAMVLETAVGAFSDHLSQAEFMQKHTPIYFDNSRNYWAWSSEDKSYHRVDDTDILLAARNVTGDRLVVTHKVKNEIMESIRITGRARDIEDPAQSWIQFKNAVFDIDTNETFDATPEYMFANPIPHNLGESDETPTIDELFTEWVGKDAKQILYEILAYALWEGYPIHRIFALLGSGRNGKGQFMTLVDRFIGTNNTCTTDLERLGDSRFEAANLYHNRVAFVGETNFATMSKTAQLKRLSGEDLISGEFKRANAFKFVNHAKIIIATNSLPETTDKTNGFFARWIIVDFPNEFDNGVPVIDSIEEWEYENLCRKCVGILKDLLARGKFHNEGSMKMKEERYEEKSNPLKIFIDKYCRVDYDAMIPFWEFYEAYEDWHEEHTFRKLTKVAVGKWLKQNEYGVYSHRWSDKNWKTIFGIEFKRIKQSELK